MGVEELHDPGFVMASARLRADQSLDEARRTLLQTVEGFVKEPPSKEEVDRVKMRLLKQIDEEMADGMLCPAGDDTLRAIHTPGHRFDHLCFYLEKAHILFAGDMISGITTNVIAPPDGDMLDYLNSLERLQELDIAEIVPGHGPPIRDPQAKIAEYIAHRQLREQQVMEALEELPRGVKIPAIVKFVYTDVDPKLHTIAAWSVEAHLIKLEREGLAERLGDDGWALVEPTA